MKVIIDVNKCKGCGLCVEVCPQKSLKMSDKLNKNGHYTAIYEDNGKCTSCGFCYLMCPEVCIEINK